MARKEFDNTFASKATESTFEREILVEQPDRSAATSDENAIEKPYEYEGGKSIATETKFENEQLVEQPDRSAATSDENKIEF